jgi:hypothetical protein
MRSTASESVLAVWATAVSETGKSSGIRIKMPVISRKNSSFMLASMVKIT